MVTSQRSFAPFQTNGEGGQTRFSVVVVGARRRRGHRAGQEEAGQAQPQVEGLSVPGPDPDGAQPDPEAAALLRCHFAGRW